MQCHRGCCAVVLRQALASQQVQQVQRVKRKYDTGVGVMGLSLALLLVTGHVWVWCDGAAVCHMYWVGAFFCIM